MSEDDRVHGLLEIIPADLRVKLLEEQEKGKFVEYDDLREEIVYRVETHNEHKGGKKINLVRGEQEQEECSEEEWKEWNEWSEWNQGEEWQEWQ